MCFFHIYFKRFIPCYTWGNYQTLKEIILADDDDDNDDELFLWYG